VKIAAHSQGRGAQLMMGVVRSCVARQSVSRRSLPWHISRAAAAAAAAVAVLFVCLSE